MHGVDELYEVYDEQRVTARKAHQCSACSETIRPGDRYVRVKMVFDGSAETIKRCARCQSIHEHLRDTAPGCGDVWPDEKLDCGDSYEDVFGEPPPDEIAALAFWRPGDPPTSARAPKEAP